MSTGSIVVHWREELCRTPRMPASHALLAGTLHIAPQFLGFHIVPADGRVQKQKHQPLRVRLAVAELFEERTHLARDLLRAIQVAQRCQRRDVPPAARRCRMVREERDDERVVFGR